MGYLHDQHGISIVGLTPPGTCPECAVAHPAYQPHQKESLTYQYKFYDKHGRWPSWADAMEHCPQPIKEFWTRELKVRGVDVEAIPESVIATVEIVTGEEAPE